MNLISKGLDVSEVVTVCRDSAPFRRTPKIRRDRAKSARSRNSILLFGQHDNAWIDRLILVIRIIVDYQGAISIEQYGVTDDLAVESFC